MANKIVLDNKRRGGFGSTFRPGDSFVREIHGNTVTFRKLEPVEPPASPRTQSQRPLGWR